MASAVIINNNFTAYQKDFTTDTGLTVKDNMELYIHYYNARSSATSAQLLSGLANNIANDFAQLPGQIRLQIAEMISSHETIKQLLNKKP